MCFESFASGEITAFCLNFGSVIELLFLTLFELKFILIYMKDLFDETLRLAKQCDVDSKEICREAEVNHRWYLYFLEGKYEDVGVRRIQRLYRVLKKYADVQINRKRA